MTGEVRLLPREMRTIASSSIVLLPSSIVSGAMTSTAVVIHALLIDHPFVPVGMTRWNDADLATLCRATSSYLADLPFSDYMAVFSLSHHLSHHTPRSEWG